MKVASKSSFQNKLPELTDMVNAEGIVTILNGSDVCGGFIHPILIQNKDVVRYLEDLYEDLLDDLIEN